jgi:hypothetical protein
MSLYLAIKVDTASSSSFFVMTKIGTKIAGYIERPSFSFSRVLLPLATQEDVFDATALKQVSPSRSQPSCLVGLGSFDHVLIFWFFHL